MCSAFEMLEVASLGAINHDPAHRVETSTMLRALRWTAIICAVLIITGIVAFGILETAGSKDPMVCADRAPDLYGRCSDLRTYLLARSSYVASLIGLALSFLATIALVVTIILSARATKAAVDALDLARISIDHARATSSLELRPYLTHFCNNLHSETDSGGAVTRWLVKIQWKNTGKTPARRVMAKANLLVSDSAELPKDFTYPDRSNVTGNVGIVGIDSSFSSPTAWFSLADASQVIAGKSFLHFWGWVEYDGVEPNLRFRTEFHGSMALWGDATNCDLNSSTSLESGFNGIDEACLRLPAKPSQIV